MALTDRAHAPSRPPEPPVRGPQRSAESSEAGTIVPVVVLEAELAGGLLPVHLANVAGELPVALPAVGRPAGGSGAGYPQLVYIS